MQIDLNNVKIFTNNQDSLNMLLIVCRKAAGKPVDELIIADCVSAIHHNSIVAPSVFEKKEKKEPEKKKETEAKPETK